MGVIIYTDGSAHPNPGPGGFGVIVLDKEEKLLYYYNRQFKETTNNEMEIKAILFSFLNFGVNINNNFFPDISTIYTDSSYCINIFTKWMFTWANNSWLTSNGFPPKNLELIQTYYDRYQQGYRIELKKVKGHSDNKWNNLVDQLATGKIKEIKI